MAHAEPLPQVGRRAGDAERDAAIEALSTAAGRGELSLEELEERIEAAAQARTLAELRRLISDVTPPADGVLGAPREPAVLRLATSNGHVDRLGSWLIPERIDLELRQAASALDLRTSPLPVSGVEIRITAQRSSIRLLVPADIRVDFENLGIHRSKAVDRRRGDSHLQPSARVRVSGDLVQSNFKVLRPKR